MSRSALFSRRTAALAVLLAIAVSSRAFGADRTDVLFTDFEAETYGDWTAGGDAFGEGPAEGMLPKQMKVSGYHGKRLASSFHGGDGTTGTLTSPEFKIARKYISFLIGGGGFEAKTCVNLLVDGKVVRSATGPNLKPGGSEALEPAAWDVAEFDGKSAKIQAVDAATGGWGHISLDRIVFTDAKPEALVPNAPQVRQIPVIKRFLHFPVKNGARVRTVKVLADGQTWREFKIEAADADPDWWASLDVSAWNGKSVVVDAGMLPATSNFITSIDQGDDAVKGGGDLYREALRPLAHFSPRRGWNNDPNGLVFFNGEYHLFFQFNPYGTKWGNMHWGHAVSRDLMHWQELEIALYPDAMGPMFSGSAVVDWNNSSGFGKEGKPPLVLIYTAAGTPATQCIAWSLDGRTFTKFDGNPVVKQFTPGNRDPKVFWHEPTQRWVMVMYVGLPQPGEAEKKAQTKHTIRFLTSPNLKEWEVTGEVEGLYECPDFFPLAVDGDPAKTKWLLMGAGSEYFLGTFDGKTFKPETPKLKGHLGRGFYAAQSFSDIPAKDGRRILIGWMQASAPGMPFSQAMSIPLELKLLSTPEGPRLSYLPAKEIEGLHAGMMGQGTLELKPGARNPLARAPEGDAFDLWMEFEPSADAQVELIVRGVKIRYDAAKQELAVNDIKAAAPLRQGKQRLIVIADRTCFEIFASDGLCFVPLAILPKPTDLSVELWVTRGSAKLLGATVHTLKPAWEQERK